MNQAVEDFILMITSNLGAAIHSGSSGLSTIGYLLGLY